MRCQYRPGFEECSLASPESSSKAASDTCKSPFHEDISLWHTKYVARTTSAAPVSHTQLCK